MKYYYPIFMFLCLSLSVSFYVYQSVIYVGKNKSLSRSRILSRWVVHAQ